MSQYIETTLVLDSLDILNLETLVQGRIDELEGIKSEHTSWFTKAMADEQIEIHKETLKKLNDAHEVIRARKKAADVEYMKNLRAGRLKVTR